MTFTEEKHPRWPKGLPGKGGKFMPVGKILDTPGTGSHSVSQDLNDVSGAERTSSKSQKGWRKKLKAQDKAAIGAYQSGPGYPVINDALRSGGTPSGNIEFSSPVLGNKSVDAGDAVARLDKALETVPPITEPMHLWRGIDGDALGEILNGTDVIDAKLTDDGFASVSLDPNLARQFSDENGAVFHILAPPGSKVADLGAVNPQGGSDLLLPRGSGYTVVGTRMEDGVRIIDAELQSAA